MKTSETEGRLTRLFFVVVVIIKDEFVSRKCYGKMGKRKLWQRKESGKQKRKERVRLRISLTVGMWMEFEVCADAADTCPLADEKHELLFLSNF